MVAVEIQQITSGWIQTSRQMSAGQLVKPFRLWPCRPALLHRGWYVWIWIIELGPTGSNWFYCCFSLVRTVWTQPVGQFSTLKTKTGKLGHRLAVCFSSELLSGFHYINVSGSKMISSPMMHWDIWSISRCQSRQRHQAARVKAQLG